MFTSFLKQSDVSHSQISDPQYRETKKDIIIPIKRGWVRVALKDYLIETLKKHCGSLRLVF